MAIRRLVAFFGLLALLSSPAPIAFATTDCSILPGTRAVMANDAIYKLGMLSLGECYDPSNAETGLQASDAKEFLRQYVTRNVNVSCFNAAFAEKLKNMIQAVPAGLPKPVINDGYRSPVAQANLPAGSTRVGPCGSYHQYGLAADFNNTGAQTVTWIRANVSQFGLAVIGAWDPAHVQDGGARPPTSQCAQSCNGSTGGYGTLDGSYTSGPAYQGVNRNSNAEYELGPGPSNTPMQTTPTAPLSNAFRNLFNPASLPFTPVTVLPVGTSTSATSTVGLCSPQFYCSGNAVFYQTSSCTQQQYQACPSGCASGMCNAESASTTGSRAGNSGSTSIYDLLNQYLYGSSTSTGSGANASLDVNGISNNSVSLVPVFPSQPTPNAGLASNTYALAPSGGPTFVSPDLANSNYNGGALIGSQTTGFQAMLQTLKTTLLGILAALKPFGGTRAGL